MKQLLHFHYTIPSNFLALISSQITSLGEIGSASMDTTFGLTTDPPFQQEVSECQLRWQPWLRWHICIKRSVHKLLSWFLSAAALGPWNEPSSSSREFRMCATCGYEVFSELQEECSSSGWDILRGSCNYHGGHYCCCLICNMPHTASLPLFDLLYQKQNQKPSDEQRNKKKLFPTLSCVFCSAKKDKALEQCWRNGAQGALRLEVNTTALQQSKQVGWPRQITKGQHRIKHRRGRWGSLSNDVTISGLEEINKHLQRKQ